MKYLITVILACTISIAHSQIGKDSIILHTSFDVGSFGYSIGPGGYFFQGEIDGDKIAAFSLSVYGGYMLSDLFELGLYSNYIYTGSTTADEDFKYRDHQFKVGPFGRFYFTRGKFKPLAQVSVLYGKYISKSEFEFLGQKETNESKFSVWQYSFAAGISIELNRRIYFTPLVGYGTETVYPEDDDMDEDKLTLRGFKIQFGFDLVL